MENRKWKKTQVAIVLDLQPIKVTASEAIYETTERKSILTHLYEKSEALGALMSSMRTMFFFLSLI